MAVKKILFVAYGGGHAQSLVPVIKRLKEMQLECVVLGVSTGALTFRAAGIDCLDFTHLVPDQFHSLVETYGSKLLAENHNPSSGLTQKQSIAYLGLCYLNNVVREGQKEAARLYQSHGRRCFLPLDTMETLIAETQPDLVVTSVSPRTELAARIIAFKLGIKCVAIADNTNPVRPSNPVIVDTLCVPNEIAKANWSDRDYVAAKRIVVTGNPTFDKLLDLPKVERKSVLFCQQACKFNPERNEWQTFDEHDLFEHFDQWEKVAESLSVPCEVRLHPTIDAEIFSKWKAQKPSNLVLDVELDVGKSLSSRKVVIGNLSTILTEALLLEAPVIVYLYKGETDTLDGFVGMGMVKSVYFDDTKSMGDLIFGTIRGEIDFSKELDCFKSQFPSPPAASLVVEQILKIVGPVVV